LADAGTSAAAWALDATPQASMTLQIAATHLNFCFTINTPVRFNHALQRIFQSNSAAR
jgi:hypothetical protein